MSSHNFRLDISSHSATSQKRNKPNAVRLNPHLIQPTPGLIDQVTCLTTDVEWLLDFNAGGIKEELITAGGCRAFSS